MNKVKVISLLSLALILSACQIFTPPQEAAVPDKYKEVVKKSINDSENLTEAERDLLGEYDDIVAKQEQDKIQEDYKLVIELEKENDKKQAGTNIKGSCNAIANSSTCLEYVGSSFTEQHMRLNCSDMGEFSLSPCPSTSLGGCNVGGGTMADMISWFYGTGGEAMDADDMKYAKQACEATPMSRWMNAR